MTKEIIGCSKCNGSGKFTYKSGIIGHCYQCNGKGKIKKIPHKNYLITIVDNEGKRIKWLYTTAASETTAEKKAKDIAKRGCYSNQVDTVKAEYEGITYTYKSL